MRPRHALASLLVAPLVAALTHCGGPTPPGTGGAGTPRSEATAAPSAPPSSAASDERWIEEASAPATPGGKATTITEYHLDVTKTVAPKAGYAGPTSTRSRFRGMSSGITGSGLSMRETKWASVRGTGWGWGSGSRCG